MNTTTKEEKANSRNFRSSISVSNKEVCEDEACIGKGENATSGAPEKTTRSDKSDKKTSGTSMTVRGEDACSEEACIGKK